MSTPNTTGKRELARLTKKKKRKEKILVLFSLTLCKDLRDYGLYLRVNTENAVSTRGEIRKKK